ISRWNPITESIGYVRGIGEDRGAVHSDTIQQVAAAQIRTSDTSSGVARDRVERARIMPTPRAKSAEAVALGDAGCPAWRGFERRSQRTAGRSWPARDW